MAYDRFDRDERSQWSDDRFGHGRDERGFWDRASDEVASWFGDEDAERRRRQDSPHGERMGDSERNWRGNNREWQPDRESQNRDYSSDRSFGRDYDRDRTFYGGSRSDRDFNYDRGVFNRGSRRELLGARDESGGRDWGRNPSSSQDRDFDRSRGADRGFRPMTGEYGRGTDFESDQFFAASGYGIAGRGLGDSGRDLGRSRSPYGRDQSRRTSFAGSRMGDVRDFDPHYRSWRDRHLSDLDRDYDDYQRENQSRFENDFTSWRQKRQQKRGLLDHIREHMEVVGNDDKHVGTVDRIVRDHIILAKSDPESGGVHNSLSCSEIDRIEGDKVILDCSADEARGRSRDESRGRALFEREDQAEMGPRALNRSFEGTYR